jgi:hypothetical protein
VRTQHVSSGIRQERGAGLVKDMAGEGNARRSPGEGANGNSRTAEKQG